MKEESLRRVIALLITVLSVGAGIVTPFVAAPSSKDKENTVNIEEAENIENRAAEVPETPETPAAEEETPEPEYADADVEHVHNMVQETVAEATCLNEGTVRHYCTDCEYSYVETILPAGHTAGEWRYVSDTQKVLTCTVCGETLGSEETVQGTDEEHHHKYDAQVVREATCAIPGEKSYTCRCGANYTEKIPVSAHNFSITQVVESTCLKNGYVLKKCSVCGAAEQTAVLKKLPHTLGDAEITKEPTCTAAGEQKQTCSVCGEDVVTAIPASGHALSDYTVDKEAGCETEGSESAVCDVCGETVTKIIPAKGHNFVLQEKTDSTCTDEGMEKYACDVCGEEKTAAISAKGHQESDWIVVTAPGCETDGRKHTVCNVCGSELKSEALPAAGHSYRDWETDREADCTNAGLRHRTCSVCKDVIEETIQETGYTEGDWKTVKEATDLEEGSRVKKCVDCGETIKEEVIPRLPHTHEYTAESDRVEADCTNAGSVKLTCRCGASITQTLPALGHAWEETQHKDAACDLGGYTDSACSRCGDTKRDEIDPLGHIEKDWETVKEATDLEEGKEVKTCERCGSVLETRVIEKLPHIHDFATETEKQDATCVSDGFIVRQCRCGETEKETIPAAGHTAGEWQTAKEPSYTEMGVREQYCVDCGTKLATESIDVVPHEHDYEEIVTKEAGCLTNGVKTRTCRICGDVQTEVVPAKGHNEVWEIVTKATCTENGTKVLKCAECGNISETQNMDALGHSDSDWIVDKEADCTETGTKYKNCTRCGAVTVSEIIPAKGHSFGGFETTKEPTCTEAGEQTKTCADCGESATVSVDPIGHSYGDWIVDTEPTEDSAGKRHKECSNCGDRITEDIDPLPKHDHSFAESARVDSTCTAAGTVTYTCSECGESYDETIPMKDHVPGDWETKVMATEQETGLRVKKCVNCGTEVETEIIEKIPHLHKYDVERVEPTCVKDGYVKYTCGCGDSYRETISATGHDYEVSETLKPTCGVKGKVTHTCTKCGDSFTEEIEALEHNYVETSRTEPTCVDKGEIKSVCENCGDTKTEEIAALGHDYEVTNTAEATCTADGYIESICRNCGDTKVEENGKATGHAFGEWEVVTEAKLGKAGEKKRTCEACKEVESEEIPMLMTDGVDSVYYIEIEDGSQYMIIGHFEEDAAAEVYRCVNEHRKTLGITQLTLNDYQEMTNTRVLEMCYQYNHSRPNGKPRNFAENGFQVDGGGYTGEQIFEAWMTSSGHRYNIEDSTNTYMGVAVFEHLYDVSPSGHKYYRQTATQTFGEYDMAEYESF